MHFFSGDLFSDPPNERTKAYNKQRKHNISTKSRTYASNEQKKCQQKVSEMNTTMVNCHCGAVHYFHVPRIILPSGTAPHGNDDSRAVRKLNEDLEDARDEIAEMNEELAQKTEEVERLKATLKDMEEQRQDLQKRRDELEKETLSLREGKSSLRKERRAWKKQKEASAHQILQDARMKADAILKSACAKEKEMMKMERALSLKNVDMENREEALDVEAEGVQRQKDDLKRKKAEVQAMLDALNAERKELRKERKKALRPQRKEKKREKRHASSTVISRAWRSHRIRMHAVMQNTYKKQDRMLELLHNENANQSALITKFREKLREEMKRAEKFEKSAEQAGNYYVNAIHSTAMFKYMKMNYARVCKILALTVRCHPMRSLPFVEKDPKSFYRHFIAKIEIFMAMKKNIDIRQPPEVVRSKLYPSDDLEKMNDGDDIFRRCEAEIFDEMDVKVVDLYEFISKHRFENMEEMGDPLFLSNQVERNNMLQGVINNTMSKLRKMNPETFEKELGQYLTDPVKKRILMDMFEEEDEWEDFRKVMGEEGEEEEKPANAAVEPQ